MKKIYTTLALLIISVMAFSQPYYVYTAKASGLWYVTDNWTIAPRLDGVAKHRVIIPASFNITADNNVNSMGLGNVEVFISGTLTMASNTTINLTASSTIQLNSGFIAGSLGNQQIFIGSVMKYRGNLDGLKTGNSIADNTTGAAPNGFRSLLTLPVNFTGFYINKSAQDVQLTWSTDKEIENSHFDVERSFNGIDWKKIAVVFGTGTTNSSNQYSYNDKSVSNAVIYYRLRQVDVNGRFIYSSIKTIRLNESIPTLKIYGSDKTVVIDLNSSVSNNLAVSILTSNGQLVKRQSFNNPSYKVTLQVQNVPTGTYVIQVSDGKGLNEVKKVIL